MMWQVLGMQGREQGKLGRAQRCSGRSTQAFFPGLLGSCCWWPHLDRIRHIFIRISGKLGRLKMQVTVSDARLPFDKLYIAQCRVLSRFVCPGSIRIVINFPCRRESLESRMYGRVSHSSIHSFIIHGISGNLIWDRCCGAPFSVTHSPFPKKFTALLVSLCWLLVDHCLQEP